MIRIGIRIALVAFGFIWIRNALCFPTQNDEIGKNLVYEKRVLTPEEAELADEARNHIANVVQRNLIRLFAAMTVEEKHRQVRQTPGLGGPRQQEEEEEEDPSETATINPHTLPQVAALLGAIFSGNLNLTNVVDRAFYLVPDAVRSQVTGLFKLLGGKPGDQLVSGSTVPPAPVFAPYPLDTTTVSPENKNLGNETITDTTESGVRIPKTTVPDNAVFGLVFETPSTTASSVVIPKPTLPSLEPVLPIAEDNYYHDAITEEELKKAEEEVIENAKLYEPFSQDKEPRFFLGPLRQMFKSDSLNLTAIFRAMPDLFKGARQAFVLLESLGQIVSGEGLDEEE